MNVQETYLKELKARGYQPDEAQQRAVDRLQQCYDEWVAYKARRSSTLRKMLVRPELPRGVYMWGGVGRGWCARRACTSTNSCARCIANWKNYAAALIRWTSWPAASPGATA
jgi:hypothetical protein